MRVPQEVRDCVVYVYDGDALLGTGFLVGVPFEGTNFLYVVTARHVIRNRKAIQIRANSLDGGTTFMPAPPGVWWESYDAHADVACAALSWDPKTFSPRTVHINKIADDDYLARWWVGPGDEVMFTGLFQWLPGKGKNLPIVRFGQIAMMNEEPVPSRGPDETTQYLDVILVEARSFGGHSGSPAFVYFSLDREMGKIDIGAEAHERGYWRLLGLVSGHWEPTQDVIFRNTPDNERDPERGVKINAGIAMVTPGQHIVNLLRREDVVKDREERLKRQIATSEAATLDSAAPEGFTPKAFEDALRRVSRRRPKPSESDQGRSGT